MVLSLVPSIIIDTCLKFSSNPGDICKIFQVCLIRDVTKLRTVALQDQISQIFGLLQRCPAEFYSNLDKNSIKSVAL